MTHRHQLDRNTSIFKSESYSVRVVMEDSKPYLVATDVLEVCGYRNPSEKAAQIARDITYNGETKKIKVPSTHRIRGTSIYSMWCMDIPAVREAISRSKIHGEKKKWLENDVIKELETAHKLNVSETTDTRNEKNKTVYDVNELYTLIDKVMFDLVDIKKKLAEAAK